MPQFDFTTFSSQIFWLVICFFALYFFISSIILPRINEIFGQRKNVIDADIKEFKILEKEIAEIKEKSLKINKEADVKYRNLIEESLKKSSFLKESELSKFKENSQNILEKSKKEIDLMVEKSQDRSEKMINDLQNLIKTKILN